MTDYSYDYSPTQDDSAISAFKTNIPAAMVILGETQTKILEQCLTPNTINGIADSLGLHYQTVRQYINEMSNLSFLQRTGSKGKTGYRYWVNTAVVNAYLATNALQKYVGLSSTIPLEHLANRNEPRPVGVYKDIGEPKESLPLKVGTTSTNLWKFMIAAIGEQSQFKMSLHVANLVLGHVWYRNYLYTSGTAYTDLPEPNIATCRQILTEIEETIQEHLNALRTIIKNQILWLDQPDQEVWRIYGDFPLNMAKSFSDAVGSMLDNGRLTAKGLTGNINTDYDYSKAVQDRLAMQRMLELTNINSSAGSNTGSNESETNNE